MLKRKLKPIKEKILLRIRYFRRFRPWKKNGKWVLVPSFLPLQYDAINLDINNTCNLRCRFCFNVFEPNHFHMTKELFTKVLPILPMTKDAGDGGTGFYLSCLYEPSDASCCGQKKGIFYHEPVQALGLGEAEKDAKRQSASYQYLYRNV